MRLLQIRGLVQQLSQGSRVAKINMVAMDIYGEAHVVGLQSIREKPLG